METMVGIFMALEKAEAPQTWINNFKTGRQHVVVVVYEKKIFTTCKSKNTTMDFI